MKKNYSNDDLAEALVKERMADYGSYDENNEWIPVMKTIYLDQFNNVHDSKDDAVASNLNWLNDNK